ncbi:hypothetical protein UPYG_G00300680 [Umbra pygmaea]|uniref:Ig-like domain-containing protein n=1 Tax=Umbra pygmaea TaxID=75934 RepID=A0ABD0WPX7_UMBPY
MKRNFNWVSTGKSRPPPPRSKINYKYQREKHKSQFLLLYSTRKEVHLNFLKTNHIMTPFGHFVILLNTAASTIVLNMTPKNPVAHVGDRLVVTCSASQCVDAVTFSWRAIFDKPLDSPGQSNESASQLVFDPVELKHQNLIVCEASCGIEKTQKTATVKVFAFSKDPVISGSDLLTEGQDRELTCTVPDVYPAQHLVIDWLLGDEVLIGEEHPNLMDGDVVQTVTSVLKYKPKAQDHGQTLSCRATLDTDTVPKDQQTRKTVASMTVQYSPRNVNMSTNTQVNIGDSFTLMCHADGHPKPTVLWRRLEQDGHSVVAGNDETLLVKEALWSHSGQYECVAQNTVGNLTAHLTVNVQGPPEKPILRLTPSGELKEGDNVTISCYSESGPHGHVALRQVTGVHLAVPRTKQGHASTSITIQSLSIRDSGRYECEASNPYGNKTSYINFTVREHLLL